MLKKTEKEYRELYQPNTEEDKTKTNDPSMISIAHFLFIFGNEDISRTVAHLYMIGDSEEERIGRIAHFFYHLIRRHDRQIFK